VKKKEIINRYVDRQTDKRLCSFSINWFSNWFISCVWQNEKLSIPFGICLSIDEL